MQPHNTPKCMQVVYDKGYANSDEPQTDRYLLLSDHGDNLRHATPRHTQMHASSL